MNSEGGSDIEGTRFERLKLGSAFGYRELWLIYEPRAGFTEWDKQYLKLSAEQMIENAALRQSEGADSK